MSLIFFLFIQLVCCFADRRLSSKTPKEALIWRYCQKDIAASERPINDISPKLSFLIEKLDSNCSPFSGSVFDLIEGIQPEEVPSKNIINLLNSECEICFETKSIYFHQNCGFPTCLQCSLQIRGKPCPKCKGIGWTWSSETFQLDNTTAPFDFHVYKRKLNANEAFSQTRHSLLEFSKQFVEDKSSNVNQEKMAKSTGMLLQSMIDIQQTDLGLLHERQFTLRLFVANFQEALRQVVRIGNNTALTSPSMFSQYIVPLNEAGLDLLHHMTLFVSTMQRDCRKLTRDSKLKTWFNTIKYSM